MAKKCNCNTPVPEPNVDTTCIADKYRVTLVSLGTTPQGRYVLTYQVCSCGSPDISHWVLELCPDSPIPHEIRENGRRINFEVKERNSGGNFFDFKNLKIDRSFKSQECKTFTFEYLENIFNQLTRVQVGIKAGQLTETGRIFAPGSCGKTPK